MTTTQRTPQQASIDARPAREAWERGEAIEYKYKTQPWLNYNGAPDSQPNFTSPTTHWRVVAKPALVIRPGKYRMRNGEVVEVEDGQNGFFRKKGCINTIWYKNGVYLAGVKHPYDLVARVETRWRPWKSEEVPVGTVIKTKETGSRWLISGVDSAGSVYIASTDDVDTVFVFDNYVNLDDSPCGVEEEV